MKILLSIVIFATVWLIPSGAFAANGTDNHAGVIIDTGKEVKTACIAFQEDSITGARALELANSQPVFQSFSGNGRAVCALCGVGCPAGGSCLTCMGSTFWNYFRAPQGNSSFTLSGVGAGSSTVSDGDVEGWKFGVGQKPPYKSFNTICGIKTNLQTDVTTTAKNNSQKSEVSTADNSTSNVESSLGKSGESRTDVETKVLGEKITKQSNSVMDPSDSKSNSPSHSSSKLPYFALAIGFIGMTYMLYSLTMKNKKV